MEEMGLDFEVMAADIDEKAIRFSDPKELTLALAQAKAEAVKSRIIEPSILITSDQVVICNGEIREKPENAEQVKEFLMSYNSYPAQTVTAVLAINTKTGRQANGIDISTVYFNFFSQEDIDIIIKEGSVFNIAGGFTPEGELWAKHIKKIEGTRDSVIALPKKLTMQLIKEVLENS